MVSALDGIRKRDADSVLDGEPIEPPEGVVWGDSCIMRAYDRRILLALLDEVKAQGAAEERARLASQFRISGDDIRAALRSLGSPGSKAEAYVFAAASWVADILLADPEPTP